ncbi:MAG: Crp/Fnr family transcriptional regulator [Pseudomonadota bacterium]|nr:Crp/Fnr family transcriptional regulator [Pseudomonadota bacterium]
MAGLTDSLRWELKRNPLFEDLPESDFNSMIATAAPLVFKTRQRLFNQGDPGGSLIILLSGRVKVSVVAPNGKDCILSFMGPGEIIGEMTLLDGGPRTASVEALEPTRGLEVARRNFLPLIERNPQTAIRIIDLLCRRLRATSQMVEDSAVLGAAPRLARALLRLAAQHGKTIDDHVHIDLPLSQSALGARAGLLRESVNRQLRVWEEEHVIAREEGHIVLMQPDVLQGVADELL